MSSSKRYNRSKTRKTSYKRKNSRKSKISTKNKRRRTKRKTTGGNIGAEELMQKYGMQQQQQQIRSPTLPPLYKSPSKSEISNMRSANKAKCQGDTERQVAKCKSVIALPAERERCKTIANDVVNAVNTLTSTYTNNMANVINECGDKQLTQEQLASCKRKMAEQSQEYVAQCLQLASAIETQFGTVTLEGRAKAVKKFTQGLIDMLPGQKNKRQRQELMQQFETLVDQWIKNCNQNQNLQAAQGMQSYGYNCENVRGNNALNKKSMVDQMMSKVEI